MSRPPDARYASKALNIGVVVLQLVYGLLANSMALIADAGFSIEHVRNFYLKGPKAWGYMSVGRATAA